MDAVFAVVWTLVIYATIPFAQPVMQFLGSRLGGDPNLRKLFAGILFAVLGFVVTKLLRRPGFNVKRGVWFAAVCAGYGYFMWTMEIPSEQIHFLEFGILVVLVFRALRTHIPNLLVYAVVLPVCFTVGLIDEYIQSLVPKRVGEIADVMQWDLAAILLAMIGLGMSWKPDGLGQPKTRRHIYTAAAAWTVALFGTAAFVHVLSDFGNRFTDPDIGVFNSAFSREELSRIDASRGAEAAGILDATDDTSYGEFLKKYTSRGDPYVHESRVHLFRRDRYFRRSRDENYKPEERLEHLHVAAMENRILQKYFPAMMAASKKHPWGELSGQIERGLAEKNALKTDYESAVGKNMITKVTARQVWSGVLAAIGLLWVAAVIAARSPGIER